MHEDVYWFDTAACFKGKFIGQINEVNIFPNTTVNSQIRINPDPPAPNTTTTTTTIPTNPPSLNSNAALDGKDDKNQDFRGYWGGWWVGATYGNG